MDEKLKNCPFCGAEATVWNRAKDSYSIVCTNLECCARTAVFFSEEDAAMAWNRRVKKEK